MKKKKKAGKIKKNVYLTHTDYKTSFPNLTAWKILIIYLVFLSCSLGGQKCCPNSTVRGDGVSKTAVKSLQR